jgi:hypothetical protein
VCCSDTQGWLGFPWPLPRGWAKMCATLPWPIRGWSLQFLFFLLTQRSPRGGSGCQGCAAERSTTGATEERKEPGLDAGASEAYIASPSSRKNSSEQPQARGAAPEPARPRRLPGHGKPSTASRSAAHSPAVKDQSNNTPLRSGRGLGAASPQRERRTTPALPGASVPVLHAQCLRPTSTDGQDRAPPLCLFDTCCSWATM